MTIAACYVSCEGVIFGADSTTTYVDASGTTRHYNNAQKIFEIGEFGSSLGLVTSWGLGGIENGKSYRQLAAELSDRLIIDPPKSVEDAAQRWGDTVWAEYSTKLKPYVDFYNGLAAKPVRTPGESVAMERLVRDFFVGFAVGGHVQEDRTPYAFEVRLAVNLAGPQIVPVRRNLPVFWGVPNYIDRLLRGIDPVLQRAILAQPWGVPPAEFKTLIESLAPTFDLQLPLREAIDWIFSAIFITIKGMKFSEKPLYCGGPVEVAVVTADRRFRWVSHKGLDQALSDHSARGTY